jgi:hypothetical protein
MRELGILGREGRIILKCLLKKWDVREHGLRGVL